MEFLESEKSKAIKWFRNFADLLESGRAELLPKTLSKEDYGDELRLCGTIIPSKKPTVVKTVKKPTLGDPPEKTPIIGKMSPAMAQSCYSLETRKYTCPACKKFATTSETGLKKHYNRCEARR